MARQYLFVVESIVKPKLLKPFHFLICASIANDSAALDLGNLTNNASNSSSSTIDHDCLAYQYKYNLKSHHIFYRKIIYIL